MGGDFAALVTALGPFGQTGLVVAFFVWWSVRADRARERAESDHKAEIVAMQERRIAYDRERLETDKEIASALASLTSAIQSRK